MTNNDNTVKPLQQKFTVERFSLSEGSITEEDIEKMVKLSIRAFESARDKDGDLSQDAVLGRDWSLAPVYFRYIIRLGLLADAIYGVRDIQTNEIVALGIWFGPGSLDSKFQELKESRRAAGLYDFLNGLQPQFKEWYEHDLLELIRQREELFTEEERSRRWWCIHLCTEPQYHGRGLARSIIDNIHEQARNTIEGGFVALAAGVEVNARKYQSLGFQERGLLRAPVPDNSGKDFLSYVLSRE
ncbi:hypothetical protein DFH05DRAFT_244740 [Lentinula detonsa]|uniref:N-acetyltransferase domain-containing protein n=1 Tax=Lentinula detonsa TaxID=2804962 RepID=A0A9W8NVG8_9AGAR|nr:hypothetical protein DFH05DRAFT_244740 [Lentinula detonsa]